MPLQFGSARTRVILSVLAFLIFLLAPGAPDSPFSGVPLTEVGLACFVGGCIALAFVALFPPTKRVGWPWAVSLLVLAVTKAWLAPAAVPTGWHGVYELLDHPPTGPIGFMSGTSGRPFRIDRRIDFDGPFFNLPFLNDYFRYGTHYSPRRRDVEFPFRVRWTGYILLAEQIPLSLNASCRGELSIIIDGGSQFSGKCPSEGHFNVATRALPEGPHIIVATYTKPPFVSPRAVIVPENASRITPWRVNRRAESRSALLTRFTTGAGWAACVLGGFLLLRSYSPLPAAVRMVVGNGFPRLAVLVTFTFLLLSACRFSLGYRIVTAHILTGDDPLAYETFARDILFNGLLMPTWNRPYYFYPLYPYVLAGAHVLFGESLFGAMMLNGACLATVALLFWWLGWRHLPGWAAVISLALLARFVWKHYFPYVLNAYTDHLFAVFVFIAIGASVRAFATWSWFAWFVAGLAAAAGAATRPSLLTYPAVLGGFIVLGWTEKPIGLRIRATLVMAAGFLIGVAPFTIRNWIVSGDPVLLVNSWIQIPFFLYPPDAPSKATMVFGLGEALQQAWRLFASQPAQVITVELRKLGFTFGWLKLGPPGEPATLDFIALSVLFVTALLLRRIPRVLAFVLCAFAVSHTASMILAAPWTYFYKPILPLHLAFLLGAAFLLGRKPVGVQDPADLVGAPVSSRVAVSPEEQVLPGPNGW
jgi:hypothetical protein